MPDLKTTQETLRSPIDGTELVRLATAGANWQAPLSTIFTSTPGPWTMSKGGLTLNPTASSSTQGLMINQTGSLTDDNGGLVTGLNGNGFAYNQIAITTEARADYGVSPYTIGQNVFLGTGGSNARGSKIALKGWVYRNAPDNTAQVYGDTIGGFFLATSNAGDGGTDTDAGARGTLFGAALQAVAGGGSTNLLEVAGAEVDVGISTGASSAHRIGLNIVGIGDLRATHIDGAIVLGSTGAAVSWNAGILFASLNGGPPVSTTGTLIGTNGSSFTVANGIDFSTYTATGALLKGTTTGLGQGLVINQTYAGSPTGVAALNRININGDNADCSGADADFGIGLYIPHFTGGANTKGSRNTLFTHTFVGADAAVSAANRDYVGIGAQLDTSAAMPVTGTPASLFAFSGGVIASAGSTGVNALVGAEIDLDPNVTGIPYVIGWNVVYGGSQVASTRSVGYQVASTQTGWKYGFALTNHNGHDALATTGTVLTALEAQTVANGVDLSNLTITGNFLKGTNFTVDGSGNIANGTTSASTWFLPGAATTAKSVMRLTVGGPPTSPVDGDIWLESNTNTGLKIRINGVTKTVTVS